MPLQRRIPKRGFHSRHRTEYQLVNLQSLQCFEDGQTVDANALKEAGLIKRTDRLVKILGTGGIERKLKVEADAFSKSAREKIAQAGGEAMKRTDAAAQPASE